MQLRGAIFSLVLAMASLTACAQQSDYNKGDSRFFLEAHTYLGALNRAQRGYYLEKKQFANSLTLLALGIPSETKRYRYSSRATPTAAFNHAIAQPDAYIHDFFGPFKWQRKADSYVGATFLVQPPQSKELNFVSILCIGVSPNGYPSDPSLKKGEPVCATGSRRIRE